MNKNQSGIFKAMTYASLLFSAIAIAMIGYLLLKKESIVYVDSFKLLSQYKGTLQVKTAYEKKVAVWKANVDTLTAELNKEVSKYEKDKKGMSLREKKLSEELIGAKHQQLENYKSVVSENASREDQTVTKQVLKEIDDFLKEYGQEKGYDFILGATSAGNVVYARKGKNITDEVLKELNARFQTVKK